MRPNIKKSLFLEDHQEPTTDPILDMMKNSKVNGVVDTGETKFIDVEQYKKYTQKRNKGVSPFAFSSNYDLSRALNQSNWEQTGHAATKIIPNTILEFTSMLGNTLDFEDYKNTDDEVGNWLSTWAQEKKVGNGDTFLGQDVSIYRENPGEAMNVGDYAWWMENGSALIESAVAFVALGSITGGGALSALTKGTKALKWLSTLGKTATIGDTGRKLAQGGAGLANTLMLNQAEGIGIAVGIYDKAYAQSVEELKASNPELDDETIDAMSKEKAAKYATQGLNFNRSNMLLNLTSSFAFLRTPALARQIRNSPSLRKTLTNTVKEGFQETGEELVNLASENYGNDGEDAKFETAFRDTFTMEGLEAGFLGFIGGAAQTSLTSAGKELKTKKRPDGSRYSENDTLRERAIEQEEAKQRWDKLSQEEKLTSTSDLFMTAKQLTELKNELDKVDTQIAQARENGDTEAIGKLQLKAQELAENTFNSKAYHAFSTGTTDQLEGFYNGIAKLSEEEAEARGLDPATYKEKSLYAIQRIKGLEKDFNNANNYLDSANIYSNRARISDLRSQDEAIQNAVAESQIELDKDIADLGIDPSTILDEEGKPDVKKLSKENLKIVQSLESYDNLVAYTTLSQNNKKRKETLTKEYSNLVSDEYQKAFKESLKQKRQDTKKDTTKAAAKAKKEEASKKAKAKKETFKTKVKPEPTTKAEPAPVTPQAPKTSPVQEEDGDRFEIEITDPYTQGLSDLVNRTDVKPTTILNTLTKQLAVEEDEDTIDLLNSAIEFINNKHGLAPAKPNVQKENTDKEINEFAEFLENNSPLEEDLSPTEESAVKEKISKVINLMESLGQRGVNTANFTEVATYLQEALGKERFLPLFNDIKDVYNLSKINPKRVEESYEDIFYTAKEKADALENDKIVQDAALPEGFYNYDNESINELSRQVRLSILGEQGYTVYKSDTLVFDGLRTVTGFNKLAHLDKKYSTNVNVLGTGKFNVLNFIHSKQDISNVLDGSTDEALLDFTQLNVGSKITFVPLNKVIYDDGTIVYGDGRVEKDGEIEQKDPNEVSPIGVKLDGVLLNKVFLHTTEWINVENIAEADDVKNQKNKMYEIRKQVLEAGEKGLTTVVQERTDGFVLRNAEGIEESVAERLPKVQVGVVKDGKVYVGEKATATVKNGNKLFEGTSVVVLPVNKGVNLAMPINRTNLEEKREYIDSMINAVKLYLKNDVNDERTIQLFDSSNIDITTEEGLREYLSKFIYLPNDLDFEFDSFASYLESQSESVSLVRIAGKNIEFGRGSGIGKGARFLNRLLLADMEKEQRKSVIGAAMKALDSTLSNNMTINISKNKMNKKFILPLITDTEVNTTEVQYNDFVKEHTKTDLYSHTLSNGKEIYTIQSNIEFSTTFTNESNKVSEEASNEALGEAEVTSTDESVTVSHKGKTLKIDFDEDFSPKELTDQELQSFEDTTPSSLLIPGVPIKTQTALIEYLSAEIIKERSKEPITDLKGLLEVALEAYQGKLAEGLPVEVNAKIQKGADVLSAVLGSYNKLTSLVEENLLTYNNLKYTGASFTIVENETETINEDGDEDTINELEENEKNNWANESVFTVDGKIKASEEVKLALGYVQDVESFNIVDGKKVPVGKTSVFGLESYILFDEIVNEISGILAFNNYDNNDKVTQPTLESMLATLESWVDTKPYLHNVIERINEMPTTTQNMLVGVMSKHYTHHTLVYKSAKNNYYVNNSDSNNVASVVQNAWLQNLINSNLIVPSDTSYILDAEKMDFVNQNAISLIAAIKNDTELVVPLAVALFNTVGINLSEDFIKNLIKNPINYGKGPQSLLHLLTGSDGAIKVYLDRLNAIQGTDIQENHPFKNNSSLSGFAKEVAKRNPVYFSNSFKDVRGRTYYSYSANKFFIDRIRRLKTDSKLLVDLAAQPFSANSYWVDMMRNRADDFYRYFKYYTFDGKKTAGDGSKGKKLSQMSPAEHEESKVALFFSQNKVGSDKNYIVNVFYPTTSDKGIQPTLSVLGHKISKNLNPRTGKLTNNGINWLYDMLVEPEVSRMLAYQLNPSNHTTKGYSDGALTFNMFPHLNMVQEAFVIEEGVKTINPEIRVDESIKIKLKEALQSHIENLVADKLLTWEQYGFVDTIEDQENWDEQGQQFSTISKELSIIRNKSKDRIEDGKKILSPDATADANKAAYNYVVNYLVANVNIMQTMVTDPANFFKSKQHKEVIKRLVAEGVFETSEGLTRADVLGYYTEQDYFAEHATMFDNMGKRLAGDVAPGTDLAFEKDATFTLAHINDEESKSASAAYLDGILKKGSYDEVNSTDAQEYTTLKEHLAVMVAEGKVTKEKANEINALEAKGKFLSAEDLEIVLQPMKPVYVNNVFRNGAEHRIYVKSSSFPLISQLTRGLEIDKLRKVMLRDGVDRVAFGTAIKVGGTENSADVFDKTVKGKVLDNISLTDATFTLPRAGFKIQQEVPHKEGDKINDGSQQRKLLTSAVRNVTGFTLPNSDKQYTGEGIQNEMDATYNRIFEIKYNELVAEIDYDVVNNTVNLAKIQEVLQKEGLKRSYPLYDLEGFKLDETGEDFIVPLWMNSSSTKVESMLNSIVDNRIRKFKPKGRSYVLGSSTGFRPTIVEGEDASKKIINTSGIILDKEWEARGDGQLLGMRVENGVLKPAEIMLKPRYKDDKGNLISINSLMKDGYIDLSKLDKSLLESFAFRIPTQGLNSMSYVKVVGFLPETSGDLFLAPADWTIQMGSDFDVDKIFTNSYNTLYNKGTGAVTRYEGEDELKKLEDYLLDLHLSILGNPSKEVQSQIMNPLDFGMLGKLAEEIYPMVDDSTPGRGMSEEYQKFKYLNARAGAVGIGTFSNDSTFIALAQGKDLKLVEYAKKEVIDYVFMLGDQVSNELSNPVTNANKKRSKSDVIAAYQSLAVDNENEQGMHKLNINSYTFDAIRTLAMSGFEEDIISYFINQPIIREYVKLKTLADDTSTSYTVADMDADLLEKYGIAFVAPEGYSISLTDLKKGLQGKRQDIQTDVLALYEQLTEKGKIIQSVQSAINTDSAGMGKDLFYAYEKEAQILGLEDKAYLENADKLIGDYTSLPYTKSDKTPVPIQQSDIDDLLAAGYLPVTPMKIGGKLAGTIKFIRPTTINGFTSVRALMFNNRLWERFFPYNNSRLNLAFENIKSITNQTQARLAQNAEINQELFKDAKSYIVASQLSTYTDGNLLAERQRLLVDTKDNISIGNILTAVVSQGYTNPMLNRLTVQAHKEILPTSIQYQASATENINERALYAAFSNMLLDDSTSLGTFNEIEYTPRKLAQDMITSQLIAGGVQQANQYVKYIPMNYLHSIGFYKGIKNVNFYKETDFNEKIYTNQHIQHNPQKVKLKKMKDFLEAGMVIGDNIVTYTPTDKSTLKLPRIFSIKNDDRVKGFDLYFKSETKPGQWERVSTLGYGDIKEYSPNVANAISIIPNNNSTYAVPTPPVLPTDPKDVKDFNKLTDPNRDTTGEVITRKEEGVAANYDLKSNETFVNKTSVILDKIIENDFNPFNTLMAKEVLKNIDILSDFNFILTNDINAQASYNMKDKTIKVNLSELTTDRKFEDVILEELIHALTKPAIIANKTGAVNRLNGLRNMAINAVKKKYGEEAWRDAIQNIEAGNPLSTFEYTVVYPLINDVEFVGRLFKSKELQEILNETPSSEDGKSVLEKFWDTIVELLESIGLDIKKGSALEYATVDILSLVNQQAPSTSIQGEINEANPVFRTVEWIDSKFELRSEGGGDILKENAKEIAAFINATYKGVLAWVDFGGVVLVEYTYTDLLGKDHKSNPALEITKEFTYQGVTIPTEFELGEEQVAALQDVIDHVLGDKGTVHTIEGYAGTGKTTIIGYLQQYLKAAEERRNLMYVAPTHAATAQLANTTARLGNKTLPYTLASTFYWKYNPNTKQKDPTLTFKAAQGFAEKLFIVDEASMISDSDVKGFIRAVEGAYGKIIFMGDPKQIPEVSGSNGNSKILSDVFTAMPKSKLNKVYRQDTSSLLDVITAIRSTNAFAPIKPKKVDDTLQLLNGKAYRDSIVNDFTNDLDNTIYIAYTNKAVQNFNKAIKDVLNGKTEPIVGEKIVGYGGYNNKQILDGNIANSIQYTITGIENMQDGDAKVKKIKTESPILAKLKDLGLEVPNTASTMYMQLSPSDSFVFEDISREDMKINNATLSNTLQTHYNNIDSLTRSKNWGQLENAKSDLGAFLKRIDLGDNYFYDAKANELVLYSATQHSKLPYSSIFKIDKGIDYGYGITVHKSQGMTVDNVYLDVANIQTAGRPTPIVDSEGKVTNTEQNALYYVGMSRAAKKVVLNESKIDFTVELDNTSDEDLSPRQKTADNLPLFKSYEDRIRTMEKNIDKAKAREDFKKIEQLNGALDELRERYHDAVKIGAKERLAQIAIKGKQDMQEVAEFFESDMTVEDTLYIRKILHFWETATDTLFDEAERESKKLVDLFGEVETSANYYSDKLVKIESAYMEAFMKKYGKATTIENVFTHFSDINYAQEMTMDISRVDNELLNSIFLSVKDANIDAIDETRGLIGDLDSMEEKVSRALKARGYKQEELYDLFRQKTKNGKLTGHLVSRYNRDFDKQLRNLTRVVESERDFNSYSNYMNWARNNTKGLKLGYLFPVGKFSKEEQVKVDKYKAELEAELGSTHFNEFMETQLKGIEAYNRYKDDFLSRLMANNNLKSLSEVLNNPTTSKAYTFWKKANSPYEYYKQLNGKTDQSLKEHRNFGGVGYITQLPNKESSYDDNFKTIEGDPALYEFFNYFSKIDRQLKKFMPTNDRVQLAFSGLPHIEKSIFSAYNEKGMKIGLAPIWGELKKSIRESPESNIMSKNLDPVTGIEEKNFSTNLGKSGKTAIDNYMFNKAIEYTATTGEDPTQEMLDTWQEDIIDELAQTKSYDLPKILKVYSLTVLAYKHKSKVEDSIKLAQNILNTQQEIKRNNRGEKVTDESGKRFQYLPVGDSFVRTKNQFSHYVDSLYGKTNEAEGISNSKSYTAEEKSTIAELEEKLTLLEEGYEKGNLTPLEYTGAKKKIEAQIDEIGGYAAWSKRGDMLLKYIQLKGMGWNLMSAIANVGFGTISNVIEGAGGQIYTSKQLNKAYRMTMATVGRNATFNRYSPGESLKIRNMMNRWDILKDASNELYENPFTVQLSKKHKWLSPYNLTARTEYINQAPIMIAMMLNTPVVLENGDKTNLWEVTTEDGTIKEGVEVDTATIKKLRIKIDQMVKRNHGNYDPNSPLALKKTFIGRALGQFRTWMFEGVAARFETEKFDPALDVIIKGRYRSLADYFSKDVTPNKIYEILKALAKFQSFGKLFKDADFEQFGDPNDFKEVDVANMRRVIAEAVIYIDVYIAYMMLAMFAGSLDDDDDITKFAINSMINQGLRLRTDLTFYVSPAQFKALLRDPLPAASIIKDAGEWGTSVYKLIEGDDTLGSGVYSGQSRFLRETAQMLPLGTQGYRVFNYGIQTFDK